LDSDLPGDAMNIGLSSPDFHGRNFEPAMVLAVDRRSHFTCWP
jgi:hypothetical protein